jgi:hypothetical protein
MKDRKRTEYQETTAALPAGKRAADRGTVPTRAGISARRPALQVMGATAASLLLLAAAILLFPGCSVVFTSSVSGEVHDSELYEDDSDTSGIQDMEIYLYTDEASWTADLAAWNGGLGVLPDEEDETGNVRYFLKTVSDDTGAFTFNGLIWEAASPVYGKTGDRREIFLLFYHKTYGLSANPTPLYIVSDVTNVLPPFKIDRIMNIAKIKGYVRDLEGAEDEGLENVTVSIWVPVAWTYDAKTGEITGLDEEDAWEEEADYTITTDEEGMYSTEIVYPMMPSAGDNKGTCKVRIEFTRTSYVAENAADDKITDEGWDPDGDGYDNPYYQSPVITADTVTEMEDVFLTVDTNSAVISGKVENYADGQPLANVTVEIYIPDEWSYAADGSITVAADAWDSDPSYTSVTDDDGRYEVTVEYDRLPSRTDNRGTAPVRIVYSLDEYLFDHATDSDLTDNSAGTWDIDQDGDASEEEADYFETTSTTGYVEADTTYAVPAISGKRTVFNETLSGRVLNDADHDFNTTDDQTGVNGLKVLVDTHSEGTFVSADFVYNGTRTQVVGEEIQRGHFTINGIAGTNETYTDKQSTLKIAIRVTTNQGGCLRP